MTPRSFELGDVLSITTDKLVSPRLIEGVYDILNYMTGDNLYTHQLPRAMRECRPFILRQYPQLEAVDASSVTHENWREWLDEQVARFGAELPINPVSEGAHRHIDPLAEAEAMAPGKVIALVKA